MHTIDKVEVVAPERFLGWLWPMLKLGNAELSEKCGNDAMLYLHFQKCIIVLLSVCTFFGLAVLLPINITGKPETKGFPTTTIGNVADSTKYWAHVSIALLLSFLVYGLVFKLRAFLIKNRDRQGANNAKSVVSYLS